MSDALDAALVAALPRHGADYVYFTNHGLTADVWLGAAHFEATAPTSAAALAAAMTGLRATTAGVA